MGIRKQKIKTNTMIHPYVFPGIRKKDLPDLSQKYYKKIDPNLVMGIVADNFGITIQDILSKVRKRDMCDARYYFCAIMRKRYRYTFESIGDLVNGRDHTTAMHAIKTFDDRIKHEEGYKERYEEIINALDNL